MDIKIKFLALLVYGTLYLLARAEPVEDKRTLLNFIDNINPVQELNWDKRTSVCYDWTGVTCNHDNSRVIAVRLPAVGFRGSIPFNSLGQLSGLQILSLDSNGISGTFPSDLFSLGNLTSLYLQFNNFEGPLPLDFSAWKNLTVLSLYSNAFNGSVPLSLLNLTHLEVLNLSNNSLSGDIPDLNIPSLQVLDLSNNNLTGPVPQSLKRFPSSAFLGNKISQENSMPPAPPPTVPPRTHKSKLRESAILGIILGSCALALAFVLIALLLIVSLRRKRNKKLTTEASHKKEQIVTEQQRNGGRLTFFEGCNLAFDLEDLLRASAELLGKGTFGTSYKAALEDATTIAVKRLKDVIVGKKDFEQHMEIVGNIRHENVAPLRAYYYSKDEKLVVYDYYNQGSVSALLHAKRGENRTPLDWETRLRIAIGAARGIAHIHSQTGGKLAHGNIKASNIFINSQQYGCVCDLGLAKLMNPITPPAIRATGYRAPEVTDTRKVTPTSDVYSFGVFILELLTGKSPVYSSGGEEIIHLVRWVHSVVREEWTGEVFDVELLRYPNIEEEMVSMLQIGMSCVARMPDQRPKIEDVLRMVEEIRGVDTGNTPSGGTRSSVTTPSLTPHLAEIGPSN